MTIGLTFPVKDDEKIKSIPWGAIEPFRQEAMKVHGVPLERLYALGGLTVGEIVDLTGVAEDKFRERFAPKEAKR
jgi:hypothetical protein